MHELTGAELRRIERYAESHGLTPTEVDPFKKHYVPGLEYLHEGNRPDDYQNLSAEQKRCLLDWISRTLVPAASTKSCPGSSYRLKHWFGNESTDEFSWWNNPNGFYVTNGQFKGAMLKAGFEPDDPKACNPMYRVKMSDAAREATKQYRRNGMKRRPSDHEDGHYRSAS